MLNKFRLCVCISAFALMTASCASSTSQNDNGSLESYNRAVYKFNNQFYKYVMKPVSKGYRKITTPDVREHVRNAFSNIKEPISAANHLLQGEFAESGKSVARFAINTTLGIGGTYDVAGKGWNLPKKQTGFDNTLAAWGVPDGPFFMLPLVGPSTPRATTGLVVDSYSNPVYLATVNDANVHDKIYYPYVAANAVVVYESTMDIIDDLERNSVDPYSALKSAYLQNRNGKVSDDEVSYDFGMDDEDEEEDY